MDALSVPGRRLLGDGSFLWFILIFATADFSPLHQHQTLSYLFPLARDILRFIFFILNSHPLALILGQAVFETVRNAPIANDDPLNHLPLFLVATPCSASQKDRAMDNSTATTGSRRQRRRMASIESYHDEIPVLDNGSSGNNNDKVREGD